MNEFHIYDIMFDTISGFLFFSVALNPCVRMFRTILRMNCNNTDISEENIGQHLEDVCEGKYITDKINWDVYSSTIFLLTN